MAYFPKIGPFYEPNHEQHFYGEADGRLRSRKSGEQHHQDEKLITNDRSWNHVIQDQENLFYMEPTENAIQSNRNISVGMNHRRQESLQSVGSAGSYQSGSSESPRQPFSRQSSMGSERSSGSKSGITRQYQQHRERSLPDNQRYHYEHFQRDNALRLSDPSYAAFSENLNSENGHHKTSQRSRMKIPLTVDNSSTANLTVSQSGKRKSVLMIPDVRNIDDISNSFGLDLCEKLFGIKLCHYKQRPPRPNGASVDHVLRDRKVIVQAVIPDSQADICGQINRGDMLVGLNDLDLTWINIDDLLRQAVQQQKVKLTFQVPVVVGPKQATPPVTPTRHTPPLPRHNPPPVPPHIPLRIPLTPPPRPPAPHHWEQRQDLVTLTTGEKRSSLVASLSRFLFSLMYLTFAGQSENSRDDVIYQFPNEDNKVFDVRGLFLTLNGLLPDVTSNHPRVTCIIHRGNRINIAYWKSEQDVLLLCLPENKIPSFYLLHIFTDLLHIIQVLHGSIVRVFRDRELHSHLDQLISLTVYRVLHTGVQTQAIPHCNPLDPVLLDTLTGVRWLRLSSDDKMSCDEILSEYEAQDFAEFEEVDPDKRRKFGILGSCLFYRDYLLCSHLCQEDLQDVYLFLKYHCILHLVSKQPVDDLIIWREVYPTRFCHSAKGDNPGYREPKGRWFLLVVSMRHFLLCTIFEAGSYSKVAVGRQLVDKFVVEQSKTTLAQLDLDDTDIELQCNERLFSEQSGPSLKCIDAEKASGLNNDIISPLKSTPSPRHGTDDGERLSFQSPNGPAVMKRQGSKLSYGSNDSSGSSTSINKIKSGSKKGSMYDVETLNRSFSRDGSKACDIKFTKGLNNQLFHYVNFDKFEGIYLSPTPFDLASTQGSTHQHLLFNFYGACLRIHDSFEKCVKKRVKREDKFAVCSLEEGVMFTCQIGLSTDLKKQPPLIRYWVIGRRFPDGHEMFVCLEDGAPQCLLELAFTYNFGLT
ncbi:protein inturned-like [Mercenaria mercenaria]|uniref:protein inturned-like n=1 Tax=Mercenaria mercenaria TaxID=6596 RepID=UPI00234F26FE|nr:protein inturned-like [Mercenaria mercenaria]